MTARLKRLLASNWIVLAILLAWEAVFSVYAINSIVMVSPSSIIRDILANAGEFGVATLRTVLLAAAGLALGMAIGTALAVATWLSRFVSGLLTPLSIIFASVPVVAIIPILARLFGYETGTVLAIVAIISFFPAFVFTTSGLRALPPGSSDLFRVLGVGKFRRLCHLALPAAIPQWAIAFRLAAANAVLAAIVAEFLMGTGGLGYVFNVARGDLAMSHALGASAIAAVISIACFFAASALERKARARWS
ncbi:ABC transporter permease [uncultured Bosea sp.]|uniref:ABC transporter permease n=1 Tax=uncultured Bosea sp. TaxID=211457 RepID=UPI0025E1C0C5|nr:ABC transporter permease subunit [uncultured Bosea sp.]